MEVSSNYCIFDLYNNIFRTMFDPNQPLPKPLSCQQNWNDMLPHEKGRICLGCGKLVTDFRNKSWSDIEKVQRASPLPVCGLYSEQQFNNWGHEIQTPVHLNFSKWLKYSAVLLSFTNLFPSQVDAQTKASDTQVKVIDKSGQQKQNNAKPHKRIISGIVVKMNSDSTKLPLRNVSVIINHKSVKLQTETDSLGNFKIDITNKSKLLPDSISLVFSHIDYPVKNVKINKHINIPLTIVLTDIEIKGYAVPLINATANAPYYGVYIEDKKPIKKDTAILKKSWWKRLWKK